MNVFHSTVDSLTLACPRERESLGATSASPLRLALTTRTAEHLMELLMAANQVSQRRSAM